MIDKVTHEYYCSFEICQLLKKAGFDWKCRCYYDKSGKLRGLQNAPHEIAYDYNDIKIWQNNGNRQNEIFSAPLVATAASWLHENYGMEINVRNGYNKDSRYFASVWDGEFIHDLVETIDGHNRILGYYTLDEATEAGVKRCLELMLEEKED